MSKGSKVKGASGEREAAAVLAGWIEPVYRHAGVEVPDIKRNLMQTREGGYDLVGIDWLALEVKRQENMALPSWWRQTVKNASMGQIPFLMWRQNRRPWFFRVRVEVYHRANNTLNQYDVDMERDQAKLWVQTETWNRLQKIET